MSAEPVNVWDTRCLAASESSWGVTPNPAANQGLEFVSIDTGPAETGEYRPKKDRNSGRGMTDGYVKGRVKPLPWSLTTAMKTRGDADDVPVENALYAAAGLKRTINSATSVVYSFVGNPQQTGDFASLSLYRAIGIETGAASSRYFAEQLRGGIVKEIVWSFGDRELMCAFNGEAIGKYHLGYSGDISFNDGSGTTLTFGSAEEAYRFDRGWYQIESEIIKVVSHMAAGATSCTVDRAQLSSSGASHANKPLVPYLPGLTYVGSPIPETSCTVSVGGQTIRFTSGEISLTTGIEMGPGETGSAYVQTPIFKRYTMKVTLKGMMRREDVALIGKAKRHTTPVAVSIVCGTGAGGIVTFSLPYCEVDAMNVPDAQNDVAMWTVTLRTRDSSTGNDMATVTFT